MTTIFLVRHGQYSSPTPVIPFRMPGFHLSDEGKKQAQNLANSLKNKAITALFTSPMERTQETAAILGATLGLEPYIDKRLLEVRSPLQGMTKAEIEAIHVWDWSIYDSAWYQERQGESLAEIGHRIEVFCEEKRHEYEGKSIVIVTHGDLVMLGAALYMGLPITAKHLKTLPYVSMASGYSVNFDGGNIAVSPIII